MTDRTIGSGAPEPLGVTHDGEGINVAVVSTNGTAVDFCLFDETGGREVERIRLPQRTGDVFHGRIEGVAVGTRYGLRVDGPWEPQRGHRFNPAKLLVDPYAQAIDRPFRLHPSLFDLRARGSAEDRVDSAPHLPKGIVEAPTPVLPVKRPRISARDRVVYECHVKGFTRLHPDIPEAIRGTFAALGHPAAIAHLVGLGIDVLEVMPIWAGADERHLAPLGLTNYWNYNPVAMLAPDPRLAPGGWAEVRAAVDALHEAGIAVILDVVLNHTGESDHLGPTLSFRGLDNILYYQLRGDDPSRYNNDSGCGNGLALDHPAMLRLGLDALRVSALRGGFDGFRYDLATALGRRPGGFDAAAPFLCALAQDPTLRDLIHIAEPWDIGPGGYRLGAFSATWSEWNDRYRDAVRRFWRRDEGQVGELATRLVGSADVFAGRRRRASDTVNFVTAHDGFTLADLVAHDHKHNLANGENNRDGNDTNHSWNHGVEGATDDPAIREARCRDVRALLATLLLSRGTPMLSMGDEAGRSQGGNNNAYAQDNELSWFDWKGADGEMIAFTSRLIALRRAHPALHDDRHVVGRPLEGSDVADVAWLTHEGGAFEAADWQNPGNLRLVCLLAARDAEGSIDRVALAISADTSPAVLTAPPARPGHRWRLVIDSARPERESETGEAFSLDGRSVALLVEEPGDQRSRATPTDPAALDRLARAAGISPEWWDLSGRCVQVGDDTKRALLESMGLPAATVGDARDSLERLIGQTTGRALPLAHTLFEGRPFELPLQADAALGSRTLRLTIDCEDGSRVAVQVEPGDGRVARVDTPDGRRVARRDLLLPNLPIGRHRVSLDGTGVDCALTVAPSTCHLPEAMAAGDRRFGIAGHLYCLRHDGDQGIGDFTTLRRFSRLAAGAGAMTMGLNPIHALFSGDRERASPYSPSDRRFLDPIYIDVSALPAALAAGLGAEAPRAALEFGRLSALSHIDWSGVWKAKSGVLRAAFSAFVALKAERPLDPLVVEHAAFVAGGGEGLRRFATFEAITAVTGARSASEFSPELADCRGEGVRAFAERHARAVDHAIFLQWLAARQFAEAAGGAREAGLGLGFYRDLAVGCAPDGAEAWGAGAGLLRRVSIGAPPDPFSPDGQVWSLPPPNPIEAARTGQTAFAELIRANMAHAGALRIDHVLGLARLFAVPDGARGGEGAYIAQPLEDLLGQLALESRRASCVVVGEDLGTVPQGFRERLAEARVLSYQVLWFEREGLAFRSPAHYPRLGAACVATHDLATLAGWWEGSDLIENLELGRMTAEALAAAAEERAREKRILVDTLIGADLLSAEWDEEALAESLPVEIAAAIHAWVSRGNSALALVQADDLTGETERLNLPGTDRERPNWRRRLSVSTEEFFETPLATAVLRTFADRSETRQS